MTQKSTLTQNIEAKLNKCMAWKDWTLKSILIFHSKDFLVAFYRHCIHLNGGNIASTFYKWLKVSVKLGDRFYFMGSFAVFIIVWYRLEFFCIILQMLMSVKHLYSTKWFPEYMIILKRQDSHSHICHWCVEKQWSGNLKTAMQLRIFLA